MSIMFGFGGLFFVVLGIFAIVRDRKFLKNSIPITAEVMSVDEREYTSSGHKRTRFIPRIKYFSHGQWFVFEGDDIGAGHNLKPGSFVTIRLKKNNHKRARVAKDISTLMYMCYGLIVLGVAGIVVSIVTFESFFVQFELVQAVIALAAIVFVGMKLWVPLSLMKELPTFTESEEL